MTLARIVTVPVPQCSTEGCVDAGAHHVVDAAGVAWGPFCWPHAGAVVDNLNGTMRRPRERGAPL